MDSIVLPYHTSLEILRIFFNDENNSLKNNNF